MRTAVVCALLCAASLPAPSVAAPAPQAPPAVSVSVAVTDGADDTETGRRLEYRITVHNMGADEVPGARVEQRMPATTTSATAPGGTVQGEGTGGRKVVWRADLPAHDIQVFTATAVLGDRPGRATAAPGTLRAAATACVYVGDSYAPAACSGDLDDLPLTGGEGGGNDGWGWWAVTAAAAALLGPGVVRTVRKRRAAAPPR
ncbi:hypothetical protein ACWD6P_22775 [Streptomyces sp. NPDC002446]